MNSHISTNQTSVTQDTCVDWAGNPSHHAFICCSALGGVPKERTFCPASCTLPQSSPWRNWKLGHQTCLGDTQADLGMMGWCGQTASKATPRLTKVTEGRCLDESSHSTVVPRGPLVDLSSGPGGQRACFWLNAGPQDTKGHSLFLPPWFIDLGRTFQDKDTYAIEVLVISMWYFTVCTLKYSQMGKDLFLSKVFGLGNIINSAIYFKGKRYAFCILFYLLFVSATFCWTYWSSVWL